MSSAIVTRGSKQYSGFELKSIPNMEFWYDLSDTSTFTTSGTYPNQTITSDIKDKSPTGRDLTNTLRAGAVFNYDPVNQGMYTNRAGLNFTTSYSASLANETVFFVLTLNDISITTCTVLGSTTSGGRGYRIGGAKMQCAKDGSGVNIQSATIIPASSTSVFTWLKNNNFIYMYLNGVLVASGSVATLTAGLSSGFGGTTVQTSDFLGTVHESIAYSSPLLDSDRSAIEYYLMNKWDIQSSASLLVPTSISGCSLWLDSSDSSSITRDGSNLVSQWNDKSGYSNHAVQATATSQPTYTTTGIKFGGTGGLTAAKLTTPYSLTNQAESSFFVVETDPTTLGTGYLLGSSDTTTGRFYRNSIASTTMQTYLGSTLVYSSIGEISELGKRYIIHGFIGGGASILLINNCYEDVQTVAYGTATTTTVIGNRLTTAADANAFAGKICEVVIYNTGLSASDRKTILNYLTTKWNITAGNPVSSSKNSFYASIPYTRPFYPVDVPNCVLWLDAADQSSFTLSGSNLSAITDKSGTGKTITVSATPPTWSLTGFNTSYPCFTFTTSTQLTSTLSTAIGTGDCMFIAVMKNTGTNTQNNVLTIGTPNGGTEMGMGWNNAQTGYKIYQYGTGEGITSGVSNSTNIISIGTRLSSTMAIAVNGTTASSTGTATTNNTNTSIFIGSTSTFGYTGQICEVIIFVGTVTLTQRQQLESYLAHKWGLVGSMSSTHPAKLYKSLTTVFDPRQILSCKLWLDAYDSSTFTLSGSNITQWRDKSGNNFHAAGFIGTGTYSSNGFNSRPTVQITQNGNMAAAAPAGTFPLGMVVFVLFQKTGANVTTLDTVVSRSATYPCPFDAYAQTNGTTTLLTGDGVGPNSYRYATFSHTLMRTTTPTIWGFNIFATSPNTWIDYVNGVTTTYTLTTGGTPSYGDAATSFQIGVRGDTYTRMNGNISEIIAYNAASIPLLQRQQLEGYLAHKWGLTGNLPASHPFKKVKP